MAHGGDEAAAQALNRAELERSLLSNSTKRRISSLHTLQQRIEEDEFSPNDLRLIAGVLFETYPLYIDRNSRRAAQQCLRNLVANSKSPDLLQLLFDVLRVEANKTSVAPANSFVLTEWCCVFLEQLTLFPDLWTKWGLSVIESLALTLEKTLSSTIRESLRHSAVISTRGALRRLFRDANIGSSALKTIIVSLTTKQTASTARNAVLLGIVAGVSARLPEVKDIFVKSKKECYTYYTREIMGSRAVLPEHIANGMHDFFQCFTSMDDLQKEIVPPLEKALLRAPEIVLNDIVAPLIRSLPQKLDLSEVLQKSLMKALMSNIKSSNPTVRTGTLRAFEAIASRSADEKVLDKIAEELLNPLKQNKVTAVEQRVIHAQMLAALAGSAALTKRVPPGLAAVALKEANESALEAETIALSKHMLFGFQNNIPLDPSSQEAFSKGLADKRPTVRRIWAVRAGSILWNLPFEELNQSVVGSFAYSVLCSMADTFKEVVANPLPAAQNGLVSVAYIFTALTLHMVSTLQGSKIQALADKTSLLKQVLVFETKPSFLLNVRVFSKLSVPDDMTWAARALVSVSTALTAESYSADIENAWAQAMIYHITAPSIPPKIRIDTSKMLTKAYCTNPAYVGSVIIKGLWEWRRCVDRKENESVAVTAKSGNDRLGVALKCICLTPGEFEKFGASIKSSVLEEQLIQLLILARPELLPGVSWIDICLRIGVDPGQLVKSNTKRCLQDIIRITEAYSGDDSSSVSLAAYRAAADLAFVASETAIPLIVEQMRNDLNPLQLAKVGAEESAIFRTPEGIAYVDVLASKNQQTSVDKKAKDYDTLKWEEELRAQLAKKSTQARKLTPEEQSKVNAQIAKESAIRREVGQINAKLRRGVGFIQALATGPPTEAELWIVQAVDMLHEIIEAGAGLILGETATVVYLDCAQSVTARLGPLRQFIGVATLRAMGVSQLAPELLGESLEDLVTRVLYRLRFMGEQRPFDVVSIAYILPLIFLVLQSGGFAQAGSEEADEQLMLALEFLSFHSEACAHVRLPRRKLLAALISTIQRYNQHYKLIKDCLHNLVNAMEPTITSGEISVLLGGTIVPQVSVRTAVLQAIDASLDLSDMKYCEEIWIAYHDVVAENAEIARTIWEESDLTDPPESSLTVLSHLESQDRQLRRAAASACADTVQSEPRVFSKVLSTLEDLYAEKVKPRVPEKDGFGLQRKTDLADPWEARSGVALAFKALADDFQDDKLVTFLRFLIDRGPLGDRNATVRNEMIDAASTVIAHSAGNKVEELMGLFEAALEGSDRGSEYDDKVNEAVIILYGALARHLKVGDKRVPKVVRRLLDTLSTPSETVQFAVAECLPPLVRASLDESANYVQQMMDELLKSKKYASRRGAAYGLAGIVLGEGISALREYRIMSTLKGANEAKKDQNQRQGAILAYELLSLILGRLFEPYVIQIVPQLLAGFGDPTADVREACLDAAKTCFATLSSFGVKMVLPTLLHGLDEQQWRSKKGACDSLGAMAYLDPQQLALSLPEIIPPLTNVLNDSHKEVRASANRSLQRFGEVISNPEIKSVVSILLKALSDPTKFTDEALDALIKIQFVHYLDAPSLALVVRILERGLGDRSATKRKAAQIIGSLAHLTDRKDLIAHLPILVAGLRIAVVDPVPATRATASKALGSLIEKLGEEAMPDLIPSLMAALKSDTGAGDRLGSSQALSEVLAGLGTSRLEETLPSILQNVASSKPSVREGFMSLFIFLPACFGNSFSNYLSKVIPPILAGLADEVESIRETALKAGRLLVKNFATRAIDLLLPELERGLADDNYRIRLSSVELVGDLLFNLTGITANADEDEEEDVATEAGQSLLDVLGEERRNRVLSAIYICRCDTSGLVRTAAINVWKALVASPRTLREITSTLTQLIIRRLASSNMEQKVIAGNALGELIRKAGEGVLATLLPTLEAGLNSTDAESRQGICMALKDVISSASGDALEDYEKTLISVVRTALVDSDSNVREAAAEAFDSLQQMLGKRAVDQVLPHLLSLLRIESEAENALAALLTLLTDSTRSNIILPNLLPTLLTSPISSFNAKAIASLSEVAGSAMTRRLPHIINGLVDNITNCKGPQLLEDLTSALDSVLLSVDEFDGLNAAMSVMLALVKHDDHRKRRIADVHLATFLSESEVDVSRYYPDLIRALLISFDDRDDEVIKAAWFALSSLTKRLRKEEMEALVVSTRQVLQQVGVAGSNLPGFQLPKGINAILPIFLQGLMYGTAEQRTQAALAISDIIDRASPEALKPFVTQITGPLIRVVSERSVDVKAAILFTLNHLLEKIPAFLKPFLPQLQRTFAKSLADTSSDVLRIRAAKALGTLITMTPRIDPLIAELVTGSKTLDSGVKNAMLKALYEVVSKAGSNMSEASRNSILSVIDAEVDDNDDAMAITNARLLGALIKVLSTDGTGTLIKNRVLTTQYTKPSILALNAILLEAPEALTDKFADEIPEVICQGIKNNQTFVSENAVLAAGKYLLTPTSNKSFETCKLIFEQLASVIPPGKPVDIRRLALVVIRTVSRQNNDLVRPHVALLVPQIFASVRDMVIPVKLAAEAAFLAIFDVVEEDSAVFDKYLAGPGSTLPANTKRSLTDYFKRVVVRLAAQARERREAEGGAGGLGLSSDEVDDEREVWSVGRVDLGEGNFANE